jgi:hypothetical protein
VPLPALDCAIPEETCCPWLFDDAEYMLGAIEAIFIACVGEDDCAALRVFVSWGMPAIADTDYLTIWLDGIRRTSGNGGLNVREIQWTVLLSESNYPTFGQSVDGIITSPDTALLHAVNRHVYAHAAVLESAVATAHAAGTLLPNGCTNARVSALVPATGGGDVKGGTAGTRLTITYQRVM